MIVCDDALFVIESTDIERIAIGEDIWERSSLFVR